MTDQAALVRDVEVSEIWVDNERRLCVRLADTSQVLTDIYRASVSGVEWDDHTRAIRSPVPRGWSHAEWFVQITKDARSEYGVELVLTGSTIWRGISSESQAAITAARAQMQPYESKPVDARTMAGYVGDDRLRQEARDLFLKKQWKATVDKLQALRYPQFMDAADRRRLEIARKRSQTE
jgi:hypothetical protein